LDGVLLDVESTGLTSSDEGEPTIRRDQIVPSDRLVNLNPLRMSEESGIALMRDQGPSSVVADQPGVLRVQLVPVVRVDQ